ncbi:MAG: aconitate hydratase AcnA [Promethearchaeota archaeon]
MPEESGRPPLDESLKRRVKRSLDTAAGKVTYFSLPELEKVYPSIEVMPYPAKVLLESIVRNFDGRLVTDDHFRAVFNWKGGDAGEIAVCPARVVMQDFTGVPSVVDLAAMRDAVVEMGGEPGRINPKIPVDLVIDHSVQIDHYGSCRAFEFNARRDFERNRERYEFLRWASVAFDGFSVVPPATGIIHQVNLEYLARVVQTREVDGEVLAFPDTVLGTDSHTPMVNGLGVLGWGVGGIEAEAAVLGQPLYILMPEVVGFKLTGELREGVTATDLVLEVTRVLREVGVVGKVIEFFGPGVEQLTLPDRATLGNMSPEYGATASIFPVDQKTLEFLELTGRPAELVDLVEKYTRAQGLFRDAGSSEPEFGTVVELDLATVGRAIAGPRKPHEHIPLGDAPGAFSALLEGLGIAGGATGGREATVDVHGRAATVGDGSVLIASITSCTNTSNPSLLVAAGLLAKRAVERGLKVPAHVKTSLAPGSRVVTAYLEAAGLTPFLEALGFHLVGYGCTTCIGNSGPLHPEIAKKVDELGLVATSVVSGNRNFEGRIHPSVRANYLASPPLVVAYAIAGTMRTNLERDPIGRDPNGEAVYLHELWPSDDEVRAITGAHVTSAQYRDAYTGVYAANETWNAVAVGDATRFGWDPESTYIVDPPFFHGIQKDIVPDIAVEGARILALLGDSVTTDHISPAGVIPEDGPAGRWLLAHGVGPADFNSFGSRRGNHNVMVRGTFGNIRLRNQLVPGVEGGYTLHFPSGERMTIFEASQKYAEEGVPLVVVAGKDYGMGSSRDWAAKGTALLGVRAVIAESFERIHRSNLVGMGVLPLLFKPGESAKTLSLTGREVLTIPPLTEPKQVLRVEASGEREFEFEVVASVNTPVELEYVKNGGILHAMLREMA